MRKKSFNRGMYTLMKKGYSKQRAYNQMSGLAKRNNIRFNRSYNVKSTINIIGAIISEVILFAYNVPSKEDLQIKLIQTILPLSPATQPLSPFITLIAILLQIYAIYGIYLLFKKLIN